MDKTTLQALISQGEGFHLEFKESINTGLAKEIVAFANAKGGKVLIGVDDNGNIKSKALGNDDRSKIQSIARDCDPAIQLEIEAVEDEPNILIVNIASGLNKPYRCTSGFYMREGASSVKRTTDEIRQMFIESGSISFDDQLCPEAEFNKYFSPLKLKRFFAESKKEQILSDEDTLHNLGVLKFLDDKPTFTNTGVLFFTDNPPFFLRQSLIQCVRYKGNEKIYVEDQKDLAEDIITNIDEAFVFLRRSLDVGFEIVSGNPQRQEIWEIPYVALRETIVNSIAHRDYLNRGTHIQIEVFDDRVSVTNYGGLAKGFTKDDLGKKSAHRNPNIVDLLYRANFIEKLGTGIRRINEALENAGQPPAEFDVNEYWFSVIFKRKKRSNQLGNSQLGQKQLGEIKPKLNETEIEILQLCLEDARSRSEIFAHIKMSNETRNFNRKIRPLLDKKYLSMTEPDTPRSMNQKYYTTEIGKELLESH